jgi:hypothetical protein
MISRDEAIVLDRYLNHSVWLHADTGRPGESDPNAYVFDSSQMKRIGGRWKVTRVVRQD